MNRLSFSTADDPFYKTTVAKYYPEAVVVSKEGKILSKINHSTKENKELCMSYTDDIRDPVLKINDDRKIQIQLGGIKEPGTMIFLMVREFDNTGKPPAKEGEFDRAWFRISNEETNQTLDYSLVQKIEQPEGYEEFIPNEEDDEAPPTRNDLTYLHGVLYLDESKWVFESYKHCFQAKDYKDVSDTLSSLYGRAQAEITDQNRQLNEAGSALKKSLEEKKIQAMEAAKKQKKGGKKKKGDDEPTVEESVDPNKTVSEFNKGPDEEFDLFNPDSFKRALKAKVPRPFIFGPVEFEGLHLNDDQAPFVPQDERERVTGVLERSMMMPSSLCVHGYKVCVKKRNLKRRSSILKHARFL